MRLAHQSSQRCLEGLREKIADHFGVRDAGEDLNHDFIDGRAFSVDRHALPIQVEAAGAVEALYTPDPVNPNFRNVAQLDKPRSLGPIAAAHVAVPRVPLKVMNPTLAHVIRVWKYARTFPTLLFRHLQGLIQILEVGVLPILAGGGA